MQAHHEQTLVNLIFHEHQKEADKANEDAAEDVKAEGDPSIRNYEAVSCIRSLLQIVHEFLAEEVGLVSSSQRHHTMNHLLQGALDRSSQGRILSLRLDHGPCTLFHSQEDKNGAEDNYENHPWVDDSNHHNDCSSSEKTMHHYHGDNRDDEIEDKKVLGESGDDRSESVLVKELNLGAQNFLGHLLVDIGGTL